MSEEQEKWAAMVQELQDAKVTLERIAEEVGVTVRQVSNWKTGDRPLGMHAVKLHLLHVKHRTIVQ